jgi:transcriptional regulator with XRE-family HTH domain
VKPFGALLREARKAAGLTQLELAEKTGVVDHSYISTIERGTAPPPARDKIIALLDALGITDKAKRASFLLAARQAGEEDLEGIVGRQAQSLEQSLEEAGFVFSAPIPMPRRRREKEQLQQMLVHVEELQKILKALIAERG